MVTLDIALVLGILTFTIILFLADIVRVDVVAFLVLVLLGVTQLLPPEQLFSGFSSEAVISFIGIMILGRGLEKSGITSRIAKWMLSISKAHQYKIATLLMLIPGLLAGILRTVGTVALFLPVVNRITIRTDLARSRLLMPMAFCALLGGTLTMVGSGPLIILNSLLNNTNLYAERQMPLAMAPFRLFDVFPVGMALLACGMLYLCFARRWLPDTKTSYGAGTSKAQFLKTYGKGGDFFELKLLKHSPLIGGTLQDLDVKLDPLLSVVAIRVSKDIEIPPLRGTLLQEGTVLAMMGSKDTVVKFAESYQLKLYPKLEVFSEALHFSRAGLCEAVIPPSSPLVGVPVRELHMRRKHHIHVVALYRGSTVYQGEELKNITLHSGDTLGMFSQWKALEELGENPDFVVVTSSYPPQERSRPEKIPQAIFFFLVALTMVMVFHYPLSTSLMLGAFGMIGTGVLSVDEAYETVSWRTVFLLAGLMPLGLAMQSTGTVDWLTDHIHRMHFHLPAWVLQVGIAVTTTLFSLVMSNIGATIVLVPIALDLAIDIGVDPRMFALTVALAASNTFLIPTHQVNALITSSGGYKIMDFIRVGGGMTLLYWAVMLVALHMMF